MSTPTERGLEWKVGVLIVVSTAILVAFIFILGNFSLRSGYTIAVDYDYIGALQPGAPVKVSGIKVGKVESVDFLGGKPDATGKRVQVRVTAWIEDRAKDSIRSDAEFFINTAGVLGEQYLEIVPGTDWAKPPVTAGALIHDSGWFAVGYLNSAAIKSSRVYRRIGPMVERLAERFGPWEIFIARFIYGTRNPSSVFWGLQRLPYVEFAGLELLALTVWGSLLTLVGYHSTAWALKLIGKVEHKNHPTLLLIAIVLAFVVVALLRYFNRRGIVKIQKKVEAREHAAELAEEQAESTADSEIR